MAANIKYYTSLPQFIREGMAELTIGGDGDAYLEALANKSAVTATGTNKSWLDTALDLSNTGSSQYTAYSGGYMFLRYLAKQAAESAPVGEDDTINNTVNSVTINALGGNDYITNTGYNVTINGGDGNDTIASNYTNYLSITGGADNDLVSLLSVWYSTVDGGSGNDTIISSSNARNDSINGGAGNDLISLQSSYSGYVSTIVGGTGNDTIYSDPMSHLFKYSTGDGTDKIVGFNANSTLQIGGGTGTILGGAGNDKIYGDADNDYLRGGAGNDSFSGGKGNDTLWGDAGADTFFYSNGDGKDVIFGFENDDMLKITGAFKASYNKSDDAIYFKVGSTKNAITLKNFDATSFNINGKNYAISGKKLVRR